MSTDGELRKLNDEGLQRFTTWILQGATGPAPQGLLVDPETSDPLPISIRPEPRTFKDRFQFGRYLNDLLAPMEIGAISRDRGLWSALAIVWFDQLCPIGDA